jgi:segregation and condensation protein A
LEVNNDVVNHLLFHKALIDEDNDSSQINKYLTMAQSMSQPSSIDNVFDRSVYLMFELVVNQDFDPWDIDLVNFSSLYLNRAKQEKIDLMVAGRIIYMAWKILRLQSDHLVVSMEEQQQQPQDQGFGWEDIPMSTWMATDQEYSYTNLLMKMPEPPITEPLRRDATRKVTLMELLQAFDEVRKEAEQHQMLDELRQEERIKLAEKARSSMRGAAHEDHLEEDIATIWQRIQELGKPSLAFKELCVDSDPEERIRIFLSILFLAYEKRISVHQKSFPYGEILIKTLGCS